MYAKLGSHELNLAGISFYKLLLFFISSHAYYFAEEVSLVYLHQTVLKIIFVSRFWQLAYSFYNFHRNCPTFRGATVALECLTTNQYKLFLKASNGRLSASQCNLTWTEILGVIARLGFIRQSQPFWPTSWWTASHELRWHLLLNFL